MKIDLIIIYFYIVINSSQRKKNPLLEPQIIQN